MDPVTIGLIGGSLLTQLFGAKKSSDAAKDAAKLQADSAREALAFQKQMWGDTQRNQAPWLQAGTGAINTMTNLMGVPMMGPGTTPHSPATPMPLASIGGARPMSPGAVPLGMAMPRPMPLASMAAPRAVGAGMTPAAAATGQSSYITLQAPDGTQQQVPEAMAAAFEARGARRVA